MIPVGLATTSVFPRKTEYAFKVAAELGYDSIETMVSTESITRDVDKLMELVDRYGVPIRSVHAPTLLLTSFVWGRDPEVKLEKTAELASAVGADTVVVHPPFRWQSGYAENFLDVVHDIDERYDVDIAVENMFPWTVRGRVLNAYLPSSDPRDLDCDSVTLDFSHAALSGLNAFDMAKDLGDRLRHVHLTDGYGGQLFDEHLLPGEGSQPVAETLRFLADTHWQGGIVAEVNTRKAKGSEDRVDMLRRTLAFAREHTAPTT